VSDILDYGVLITPALVVDGQVAFSGRVPTASEIVRALSSKKTDEPVTADLKDVPPKH
jgi:hypothetical protein